VEPPLTTLGMTSFLVLEIAASALYPGGTWFDRRTTGYSFWGNFWCDLLHRRALNGEPNSLGADLAAAAMIVLALTLALHWDAMRRSLPRRTTALGVLALGAASSAGLVLVALAGSDRFPHLHSAAVVASGPLGMLAAILCLLQPVSGRLQRTGRTAGAFGLLLSLVSLGQYVWQSYGQAPDATWLPGLEKLGSLGLLTWVLLMALDRALRHRSSLSTSAAATVGGDRGEEEGSRSGAA